MVRATIELPNNIDACHHLLRAKDAALTDLSVTVQDLKRQVEYLMHQKYGRKSEQLDPTDTLFAQWFNDQPAAQEPEPIKQTVGAHERTKPTGRQALPQHLP